MGILSFAFIEAVVVTPEGRDGEVSSGAVASDVEVPVEVPSPSTRPADLLASEPPGHSGVGDGSSCGVTLSVDFHPGPIMAIIEGYFCGKPVNPPMQLSLMGLWSQDHSLSYSWSSNVGPNSTVMWPDL